MDAYQIALQMFVIRINQYMVHVARLALSE